VKRNPIDGLHGKNSEQCTKRKPEGHGASRGGPKQERHGNKRADLTDSGNREAGIVNRRYIQNLIVARRQVACTLAETDDKYRERTKYNMAKITVKIEEGMVQAVEGIPTDVTIEVRNYDVSDGDGEMVTKDENRKSCEIREWQAPE
jgi:hypothetical protein